MKWLRNDTANYNDLQETWLCKRIDSIGNDSILISR